MTQTISWLLIKDITKNKLISFITFMLVKQITDSNSFSATKWLEIKGIKLDSFSRMHFNYLVAEKYLNVYKVPPFKRMHIDSNGNLTAYYNAYTDSDIPLFEIALAQLLIENTSEG